ncbi:MAG TPA: hypothetical protein VGS97_06815 [Actinocrinis sp.]|uniref:hypothetical protein n=1 Tax=Actinocrinis sp. TaxID=1920516 RepID=UPI002DDCC177|nr:hypothetical protein [Actinocrinis sp.]HEV2343784.1 hypothetical protein [Actinocrinis sp.]
MANTVERRRRRAALRRSAAKASRREASQQTSERTRWAGNAHRADQTLWPDSVANPRRTQV